MSQEQRAYFMVIVRRPSSCAMTHIRTVLTLSLLMLGLACTKPEPKGVAGSSQLTDSGLGSSRPERSVRPRAVFKSAALRIGWPAPSPDGAALVFSGHDGKRWSLYRLKVGGSTPEPLTVGLKGHATRPNYSHDGRKVAFRVSKRVRRAPGAVWVLDLETRRARPLHTQNEGAWDAYPEWFADGRRVLVTRKRTETQSHDLVVLGDGNSVQVITSSPHYDGKPTLSPDGRWAVFPSNRAGMISLWQVDIAAGEPSVKQLTRQEARAPDWSPDGRWIAFQSKRAGEYDIYLLNVEERCVRRVTRGLNATHPEWSAD